MIGARGPFRRRGLVTDALVTGEPLTDDFLRCDLSKTTGELALEMLDLSIELLLTVRSSSGVDCTLVMRGAAKLADDMNLPSSSGNKENQLSDAPKLSVAANMGDVSKLSLMSKGEASTSGEVMLVKVVEGGADWLSGSTKRSLGDTVRAELDTEGLMAVKAVWGASQREVSDWTPANRRAPESKELLLFRSAMVATLLF